jgi:hypothetical protein
VLDVDGGALLLEGEEGRAVGVGLVEFGLASRLGASLVACDFD